MTDPTHAFELQLFSKHPLLVSESKDDFTDFAAALTEEIAPRSIIERIYLRDFAAIEWDILRYRRCKVAIVNTAFTGALEWMVWDLAGRPQSGTPEKEWVDQICFDWFSKPRARKEVLKLLQQYRLDVSAIEAKAIAENLAQLEILDRMLTVLEARRDRILRAIADYRKSFAEQLKDVSERLIEADIPQVVYRSSQARA
jgi:hypothetical protein